jgi:hypothetical protein
MSGVCEEERVVDRRREAREDKVMDENKGERARARARERKRRTTRKSCAVRPPVIALLLEKRLL